MELTNEQRRCLGLLEIEPYWKRVDMGEGNILYFNEDVIRKWIINREGHYEESTYWVKASRDRTLLLPKTGRGKEKKFTFANLQKMGGEGAYFSFRGYLTIGNVTNQRTLYSSRMAGLPPMSEKELEDFLKRWVEETDDAQMAKVKEFAGGARRHCRYEEGDFFRFALDRTHYGYGRILLDVAKRRRLGEKDWKILMGKPLIVKIYHILTTDPNVPPAILESCTACPARYIMDNRFYYGDYEIVGNLPLREEQEEYPVMYGQSIDAKEPDKIMLQIGPVYRELPLEGNPVVPGISRNNGIGVDPDVDKALLEACIAAGSNEPYWERDAGRASSDIRNPKKREILGAVLRQFGVEEQYAQWMNNLLINNQQDLIAEKLKCNQQ